MRLLITGVNPIQCGKKPRMDYISAVHAIYKGYTEAELDVEFRPVTPGEDLSKYDKTIVFLAPMTGFICKFTLGALWAVSTSNSFVTSFDDWQVPTTIGSFSSLMNRWDKIMAEDTFGYVSMAEAVPYREKLKEALQTLINGNWSWNSLVPCYIGGDLPKLKIPSSNLIGYNPSCLFKNHYSCAKDPSKIREWILAALHDHGRWVKKQGLTWSVRPYGHKKSGQPRVTEQELFEIYSHSYGVLSPEYKICGSGWWRARYGLAADAGAVILGSPEELSMVGDAYQLSAAEVEQLSDSDLKSLSKYQAHQYYKAAGSKEQLLDLLVSSLN